MDGFRAGVIEAGRRAREAGQTPMAIGRTLIGITVLLLGALSPAPGPSQTPGPRPEVGGVMKFSHAVIITGRYEALRDFYRQVLATEPRVYSPDYLEFQVAGATLGLFREEAMARIAPGAMRGGANQSVMLEFEVADVEREYARLQHIPGLVWVMAPTTFPWGHRTIYFRDPDGNLINFHTVLPTP